MYLSKKRQDYIFISLLIFLPLVIFRSILSTNFLNFWDFIVPSTWMKQSDLNLNALLRGEAITSLPIVSGRQTFSSILDTVIGNYSLHIVAIIADPLMALSAYLFARYFKVNPIFSFVLSLFSIFNPYTFIQSADSLFNIYRVVAFLPFILSYFILRVKKNIYFIFPSAFFILFPSIYGADFFLFIGALFCVEISFFLSIRKDFFKGFYATFIILIIFVVGHLNDLERYTMLSNTVQSYSSYSASHFTLFQILTFQNLFYWENSYLILMTPDVSLVLQIIYLSILLIIFIWMILYVISKLTKLKDSNIKFLTVFSLVFLFYSILFTSSGSDYLGFNGVIYYFLPFAKGIDPWDYGAFMMYSLIILSIAVFNLNINSDFNLYISSKNKFELSLFFHKKHYRDSIKKIFTFILLLLLITSVIPYFYLTVNLGNTIEPIEISHSQVNVYKYLEDHNSGYFITSPMTYGLTFNGTSHVLQGINNQISRSGVDFFYQYPPDKNAMYSSLFNNLSSFFYSGGLEGKIAFDSLATLMGIHYLINFNSESLACYWPSNSYPVSNQYIENNTDFKLQIYNTTVSLFVNPNFRGMSYASNKMLISSNPIKAIMGEVKIGLSIPVTDESSLQNLLNLNVDLFTFNDTIHKEYPSRIDLLEPLNYSIIRKAIDLNYNNTYHNINTMPASNEVFYGLNGTTNSIVYSFSNKSSYVLIQSTPISPIDKFNNTNYQDFVNSSVNTLSSFYFQINDNSEFSFTSNFNNNGTTLFKLNNGNEYMKITSLYGGEFTYMNLSYSSKNYRYHYFETIGNKSLIKNAKITFIFDNNILVVLINKNVIFSSYIPNLGSIINVLLYKEEVKIENLSFNSLIQSNSTNFESISNNTVGLLEIIPQNNFTASILIPRNTNFSSMNSLLIQTYLPVESDYFSSNTSIQINTSILKTNQIIIINTYQRISSDYNDSVLLSQTCNTFYVVLLETHFNTLKLNIQSQQINYLYLLYVCIEIFTFLSTLTMIIIKYTNSTYYKLRRQHS